MTAITSAFSTSGNALTLTVGDPVNPLTLAASAYLVSTVSDALELGGSNQTYIVTIDGLLDGSYGTLFAGMFVSDTSNTLDLTISNTGSVRGYFGIYNDGLATITNHGSIAGKSGGIFHDSASNLSVTNDGSIMGTDTGINILATATGTNTITNSGLIAATNLGAIYSQSLTSVETITNVGVIRGDILLGGGNDGVFNSFGGVIYGTTYLQAGSDTYNGGLFQDKVFGGDDGDSLSGLGGSDILDGEAGADFIDGGIGRDFLTGGTGQDAFLFVTVNPSTDFDTIIDFSHVDDVIRLDHTAFKGLNAPGHALAGTAFKNLALGKVDSSDRIIFDSAKDDLYYDLDGSGTAFARVKIAHFDNNPTLLANDIFII